MSNVVPTLLPSLFLGRTPMQDYASTLNESEIFWANLQPFLLDRGYQLRPRYRPGWRPSWITPPNQPATVEKFECEDSLTAGGMVLDAIRIEDEQKVALKRVPTSTEEIPIATFLSSPELRSDPLNSTVPIFDIVLIPGDDDHALLVMPMLLDFDLLPFRRVGEFCEAALQLLQALRFMHKHNIAHRDACWGNYMMDARKVVPKGWHYRSWRSHDGISWDFDWKDRWDVRPVQYYLIDFGLSIRCQNKQALTTGTYSRDKSVPELSKAVPYNPFMVDIYQAGNVINRAVKQYKGLKMFRDLGRVLANPDPNARPTASEAVELCENLLASMSSSTKKRRIWKRFPLTSPRQAYFIKLQVRFGAKILL